MSRVRCVCMHPVRSDLIVAPLQNTSQFELQLAAQGAEAPREFNMRVQTEDMQGMHSFAESAERGISERLSRTHAMRDRVNGHSVALADTHSLNTTLVRSDS